MKCEIAQWRFRLRFKNISTFQVLEFGDQESEKALEILALTAKNDRSLFVRKRAVYTLEDLPNNEGIPYLIKIAKSHPKSTIRKRAIQCLGDSGDPRALDALVEILKKK